MVGSVPVESYITILLDLPGAAENCAAAGAKHVPGGYGGLILHYGAAEMLVLVQPWHTAQSDTSMLVTGKCLTLDIYPGCGLVKLPDIPPLDLTILAGCHHFSPSLACSPDTAVHRVVVALGQGDGGHLALSTPNKGHKVIIDHIQES